MAYCYLLKIAAHIVACQVTCQYFCYYTRSPGIGGHKCFIYSKFLLKKKRKKKKKTIKNLKRYYRFVLYG